MVRIFTVLVVGLALGFVSRPRVAYDPASAYAAGSPVVPLGLRTAEGLPPTGPHGP